MQQDDDTVPRAGRAGGQGPRPPVRPRARTPAADDRRAQMRREPAESDDAGRRGRHPPSSPPSSHVRAYASADSAPAGLAAAARAAGVHAAAAASGVVAAPAAAATRAALVVLCGFRGGLRVVGGTAAPAVAGGVLRCLLRRGCHRSSLSPGDTRADTRATFSLAAMQSHRGGRRGRIAGKDLHPVGPERGAAPARSPLRRTGSGARGRLTDEVRSCMVTPAAVFRSDRRGAARPSGHGRVSSPSGTKMPVFASTRP